MSSSKNSNTNRLLTAPKPRIKQGFFNQYNIPQSKRVAILPQSTYNKEGINFIHRISTHPYTIQNINEDAIIIQQNTGLTPLIVESFKTSQLRHKSNRSIIINRFRLTLEKIPSEKSHRVIDFFETETNINGQLIKYYTTIVNNIQYYILIDRKKTLLFIDYKGTLYPTKYIFV